MARIEAVLFDKDGTLFDFHATWAAWAKRMLIALAKQDQSMAVKLGELIGFDYVGGVYAPDSPAIAGTPDEIAELLLPALPKGTRMDHLLARMNAEAAKAPLVEATPLAPFLAEMKGLGLRLGVATNDSEASARAHLETTGIESEFDYIAGCDSGFGAKPGAGMCLGFSRATGVAPEACVMVGDSTHDLIAGRKAGMRVVGVLTGLAGLSELAPYADIVLPDITHLPDWLSTQE